MNEWNKEQNNTIMKEGLTEIINEIMIETTEENNNVRMKEGMKVMQNEWHKKLGKKQTNTERKNEIMKEKTITNNKKYKWNK